MLRVVAVGCKVEGGFVPAKRENEGLRISGSSFEVMGCFHKIRGTIWVPIIRITIFWCFFWGPTFFGKRPDRV